MVLSVCLHVRVWMSVCLSVLSDVPDEGMLSGDQAAMQQDSSTQSLYSSKRYVLNAPLEWVSKYAVQLIPLQTVRCRCRHLISVSV